MRRNLSPFAISALVFIALVSCYWFEVHSLLHGSFAYALDDAYIHLGIAKNLGLHGVWGVCPQSWSGASSSLLWTVLLGGIFAIFGTIDWLPFCLNAVFALATLWQLDRLLEHADVPKPGRIALLIAAFIVIPFASEPYVGMEVALQCFLVLLFLRVTILSARESDIAVATVAFLLGSVRYEAILLIVLVAIGLFLQGKRKTAFVACVAAVTPAIIYAVFSTAYGGAIVPNTLLIKAARLRPLLSHTSSVLVGLSVAVAALVLLAVVVRRAKPLALPSYWILIAAVGVTFFVQLQSVTVRDQFERYYSYIYICLILIVGLLLVQPIFRRSHWGFSIVPVLLMSALFIPNAIEFAQMTPVACKNIHDEHVRLADFIRHAAPSGPVALVDIGAASYFTEAAIIDVIGLGSNTIAQAWIERPQDPSETIDTMVTNAGARFALLYPVQHYTPSARWRPIGVVAIDSNYICARDSVVIYAITANSDTLRDELRALSTRTGIRTRLY